MISPDETLSPDYFDEIYRRDADPWRFASSEYERQKYRTTLEALPRGRYEHGFEVGCSIGVLTCELAPRCAALLSVDVVDDVLAAAAKRCRDRPSVEFRRMSVPRELPNGTFDLILLSEVAYYWSSTDLDRMTVWMTEQLVPGGDLVLVHWRGDTDYPLSGDAVHERLLGNADFVCVADQIRTEYRLSVLRRH